MMRVRVGVSVGWDLPLLADTRPVVRRRCLVLQHVARVTEQEGQRLLRKFRVLLIVAVRATA